MKENQFNEIRHSKMMTTSSSARNLFNHKGRVNVNSFSNLSTTRSKINIKEPATFITSTTPSSNHNNTIESDSNYYSYQSTENRLLKNLPIILQNGMQYIKSKDYFQSGDLNKTKLIEFKDFKLNLNANRKTIVENAPNTKNYKKLLDKVCLTSTIMKERISKLKQNKFKFNNIQYQNKVTSAFVDIMNQEELSKLNDMQNKTNRLHYCGYMSKLRKIDVVKESNDYIKQVKNVIEDFKEEQRRTLKLMKKTGDTYKYTFVKYIP
jgi:hypothetical protein